MSALLRLFYGVLLWGAALWLAWLLLALANFFYPQAYAWLDIGHTLQTYVPQNRFGKQDYPVADMAQHVQHFYAMVQAIHAQGAGLAEISYHNAQGEPLGRLLTADEVLHLQDVARLVSAGMFAGGVMLLGWLSTCLMLAKRGQRLPTLTGIGVWSLISLFVLGGIVAALGFKPVFYQMHIWIFPADHPWFFYYQDSLMSSLMQAPNLFAVIGVLWLLLALALLSLLHILATLLLRRAFKPVY